MRSGVDKPRAPKPCRGYLSFRARGKARTVNRGNLKAAVNQLQQFIQDVSAQSGKMIDTATANALIAAAQKIISAVTG